MVGTSSAQALANRLGAPLDRLPEVAFDPSWSEASSVEGWRDDRRAGPPVAAAVVAVWPSSPAPSSVLDTDLGGWTARLETDIALWFAALSTACTRCRHGGQVVAVVDRPEAKGSAGWALESAVADAVEVMAKSLVEVERWRGVRVNVVSTSARLSGAGRPWESDVVGAVDMLLTGGGQGVNGTVIRVDQ